MAVKERYIGEIYADGKKVGDILSFCLKVTGDTHVWEKGVHTMTLTLEFKKAMDTKEV